MSYLVKLLREQPQDAVRGEDICNGSFATLGDLKTR